MLIQILYPQVYVDGMCDSYEARVALETEVCNATETYDWLHKTAIPKLRERDVENKYSLYINKEYRGIVFLKR